MISFVKACALGNDFVILEENSNFNLIGFSQKIANRRYGIGCDQVIYHKRLLYDNDVFEFRFFNQDGTEAEACGNGTRCAALWLMQENNFSNCVIETKGGRLEAILKDAHTVDIKYPLPKIELNVYTPEILGSTDAVYVGNPHLVCFTENVEELEEMAPQLEYHPHFPARANVGFGKVNGDKTSLNLRVWERGAGFTQACGSGACAAAYAAFKRGLVSSPHITVYQEGGSLLITIHDDHLWMSGSASILFQGVWF